MRSANRKPLSRLNDVLRRWTKSQWMARRRANTSTCIPGRRGVRSHDREDPGPRRLLHERLTCHDVIPALPRAAVASRLRPGTQVERMSRLNGQDAVVQSSSNRARPARIQRTITIASSSRTPTYPRALNHAAQK